MDLDSFEAADGIADHLDGLQGMKAEYAGFNEVHVTHEDGSKLLITVTCVTEFPED